MGGRGKGRGRENLSGLHAERGAHPSHDPGIAIWAGAKS